MIELEVSLDQIHTVNVGLMRGITLSPSIVRETTGKLTHTIPLTGGKNN